MDIRNADGSTAEACGNGARCVALLLMDETGRDQVTIDTPTGVIVCNRATDGILTIDMGAARLDWRDIPLDREADTLEAQGDHLAYSTPPNSKIAPTISSEMLRCRIRSSMCFVRTPNTPSQSNKTLNKPKFGHYNNYFLGY